VVLGLQGQNKNRKQKKKSTDSAQQKRVDSTVKSHKGTKKQDVLLPPCHLEVLEVLRGV